ncbi:MAG: iron ABC transporter permease [Brachymonas sp.]|nr:iron ABC transporter permease [Brachymonas sp.]
MKGVNKSFSEKVTSIQKKKRIYIFLLFLALIVMTVFATSWGSYKIKINEIITIYESIFIKVDEIHDENSVSIILNVRTPRILMSALVGASLSLSGLLFQGVFRNPLVEPYVLGISSGAACGAAFSIVFGLFPIEVSSFLFSILAMFIAYFIATKNKSTPLVNLILAGLIVSSIFTSILNYLKIISSDSSLREISFWLMGGFYTSDSASVLKLLPVFILGFIISLVFSWKLNILTMGNEEAKSLGINIEFVKAVLILTATLLCSTSVSQVGIISWIGLMIPHITRLSSGTDHRYLIPITCLLGASFMIACDSIARTLIMGEIPISIVTSLLGSPYLVYLLRSKRKMY